MDLIDRIHELAARKRRQLEYIKTEEATKAALVMPFIDKVLGYNVFDPSEVVPEFIADVGTKKGEKVDYAIIQDGKPIVLFECKRYGTDLAKEQASQLYRYFGVTAARFGVLTDGVTYRFYTDLEEPNKMDEKPFLEFNLLDIDEALVEELKRFTKSSFDLGEILATASELKYTKEIKRSLAEEWSSPSQGFVKFFASRVYSGPLTKSRRHQFTQITKRAFQEFIHDRISDRLKYALAEDKAAPVEEKPKETPTLTAGVTSEEAQDRRIVTTEEEREAYYIVKAVLREGVDAKRIVLRDRVAFCGVLLDNNRKPICRFYFDSPSKSLGLFDEHKKEERLPIDTVDDIYKYADRLKATVSYYDNPRLS